MRPILRSCCGIDVHKSMIKACVAKGPLNKPPKIEIRTYSTMTSDLLKLSEWLKENKVQAVAMESTGVYWKPIFNILEADFPVSIANPKYLKKVPGKKTDVSDSEWIATLLRCGLIPKWSEPLRVDNELSNTNSWREPYEKDEAALRPRIQDINSSRA